MRNESGCARVGHTLGTIAETERTAFCFKRAAHPLRAKAGCVGVHSVPFSVGSRGWPVKRASQSAAGAPALMHATEVARPFPHETGCMSREARRYDGRKGVQGFTAGCAPGGCGSVGSPYPGESRRAAEDRAEARAVTGEAKGSQECDNWLHFVPPSSCKVVEGKINPKGWCSLYAPKPK